MTATNLCDAVPESLERIPADHARVKVPLIPHYNQAEEQAASIERLRDLGFTEIPPLTYIEKQPL